MDFSNLLDSLTGNATDIANAATARLTGSINPDGVPTAVSVSSNNSGLLLLVIGYLIYRAVR